MPGGFSPSLTRAAFASLCIASALAASVACVKLPRRARVAGVAALYERAIPAAPPNFGNKPAPARPVDINRAPAEELAKLPGIGEGLAARIVEHRERYGRFRRAEHLLMVRGVGERRFERLRPYVVIE